MSHPQASTVGTPTSGDRASRQFVLGTRAKLRPSTRYFYELRCAKMLIPGEFRTLSETTPESEAEIRDGRMVLQVPNGPQKFTQPIKYNHFDKSISTHALVLTCENHLRGDRAYVG